ncbi:unnamed protein product [Coccothraustes coccothraustes]
MWHKVSCDLCHPVAWHIPGSARPRGGTAQPLVSRALCQTVLCHVLCHIPSCATSCAVPRATSQLVPCHLSHCVVPHGPHHPRPHPLCPGKDIRHSLATRTQPLRAHRHRDRGTQGHDASVAHGPKSALYFLLPLYKNKEVPHGRGHCPSMCTKNINIHK